MKTEFPTSPAALMIAAPKSGGGKTTLTLGVLRALSRRGVSMQPYKCGPDYIDPAFHTAAAGRASFNLDSWAMDESVLGFVLARAEGAELVVIEAVMGLFDGVASRGASGNGSSTDIAAVTGAPVVLVLDVSGQAQTAAATVRGFYGLKEGVDLAGVVLNRVASPRHERLVRLGLAEHGIPIFGALPKQEGIALPERHLGLIQAEETSDLEKKLDRLADFVEAHVDLDALRAAARPMRRPWPSGALAFEPLAQRIAIARDAAFSFVYPHLLEGWRAAGAELSFFSPLADEPPPASADLIWLPGGYPELHAGRLASNAAFMEGVRAFATSKPVHGECGGYMVLGETLTAADGKVYPMAGLLGLRGSFAARKLHLGYRQGEVLADCVLGQKCARFFGHEFHYATVLAEPDPPILSLRDAEGAPVSGGSSRRGLVTGSFLHLVACAGDAR